MCRALQAKGVDTVIATTDSDGSGRLPVELGSPIVFKGVTTVFFPRKLTEAFKYSPPLARWLTDNVSSFDVVHIHAVFSHSSLAAARACRRYNVPYLVRPLGSLDPWSLAQRRLGKLILWNLGVKRMLREAAAIHYTTVAERRLAEGPLHLGGGAVIPLGVQSDLLTTSETSKGFRLQYPTLEDKPYVLVLCRLDRKKGLELLLDSFIDVTDRHKLKHWRLIVAGDGEPRYVSDLKHQAQLKDSTGRVVFTGWLKGSEKAAALQQAALLVMPSRQENFGLSVAEAMTCGVPVLVSRQVNLAEEIEAVGAGWVAPLDPTGLSQTLEEALMQGDERISRGVAGQELARSRFTWPAVGEGLATLYRSVPEPRDL